MSDPTRNPVGSEKKSRWIRVKMIFFPGLGIDLGGFPAHSVNTFRGSPLLSGAKCGVRVGGGQKLPLAQTVWEQVAMKARSRFSSA